MSSCRPSHERRIIKVTAEVEYWVLELAAESRIPFCFLTSDYFAALFNRRFDGFDRVELVSCLERLLAGGDIDVSREKETLMPDRAAIEEFLDGPRDPPSCPMTSASLGPYYGLTPRGGSRWESLAHPDWERYTPLEYQDPEGTWYGEITAMDRGRVECFLAGVKAYERHSFIYEGPEEWEVLTPWKATCWKTLPRGHRVRFRCRVPQRTGSLRAPSWWREFGVWFRRPFEYPSRTSVEQTGPES